MPIYHIPSSINNADYPNWDINDEVLSYAEKKRIPINAWTINNALSWSWLYKKGVKGIITDEIPQFSQKL